MQQINRLFRFEKDREAAFRLKVIEYHKQFGIRATMAAYEISKATLYRWRKRLSQEQGKLTALIPYSRTPKNKRVMLTDPRIIRYIKTVRTDHPHLGKEKTKPLLDQFCLENDLRPVSVSTIGKIIKRHNIFPHKLSRAYHSPSSGWAKEKINYKPKIKHSPKPQSVGYIEIDTITCFINGVKRYIINAVDIKLKFQFSYTYSRLSSDKALDFFHKFEMVYPIRCGIDTVQTDNGLEFRGLFDRYLKQKQIKHLFIYPRCPKINSFVERANRSLKEEFINYHLQTLQISLQEFNQKLIEHLVWYNTERVHKSLNNLSPINYLLTILPESHMYATHTMSAQAEIHR
jgi:transposase InsO family protein